MKAKFGAIVVAGSGKIGGHVASRNRAGAYFRTKVTPVNPSTAAQATVRNRLSTLSQSWRGLTAAQRLAWNAAVQDFQKTDIFGDLKSPSGFNLYQRLNNNIVTVGGSEISSPPATAEVNQVVIGALTANITGDIISLVLSGAVPSTSEVKVFATPCVSAGVSFVKSEYRLIQIVAASATTPVDLEPAWTAKFGSLVEGQKVFVKIVFVDPLTGLETIAQVTSTIVLNA